MLILILVLSFSSSLLAQRTYPPPVYMSREAPENSLSEFFPRLYASLGLLNLFHPTAASLDVGMEYRPSRKFGIEVLYGLKTPKFTYANFRKRISFDTYHKVWTVFKFYQSRKLRYRRFHKAAEIHSLSSSYYTGLEGYASWGESLLKNDYALTSIDKIDYLEADLRKRTLGVGIRMGWQFYFGQRMRLECSYGFGFLFFDRSYTFINTQYSSRGFGQIFKGVYDDRNIGKRVAFN
ncbi:MAG: hypothetical protein AAF696_29690, partial [Bacteroidota bacterium]